MKNIYNNFIIVLYSLGIKKKVLKEMIIYSGVSGIKLAIRIATKTCKGVRDLLNGGENNDRGFLFQESRSSLPGIEKH